MSSKLLAAQQTMAGVVARRSKKDYSECFQVRRGWACARVCAAYTMSVQIPVLGTDVPPAVLQKIAAVFAELRAMSNDGTLAVVHNGIVENFAALRSELIRKGYTLVSDTDSELIAHLIADVRKTQWMPLEEAVRQAMTQVEMWRGRLPKMRTARRKRMRTTQRMRTGFGEGGLMMVACMRIPSTFLKRTRRTLRQRRTQRMRTIPSPGSIALALKRCAKTEA